MQRLTATAVQFLATAVLILLFSNCKKEHCTQTYKLYTPVYKTLSEVRANMGSGQPAELRNTGKIYVYGNYIFLNESNKGIHIIDNSQPNAMKNVGFINIPGNVDLAVMGNTLYADSYSDLVAFDISNPLQVKAKQFLNNVFPQRNAYYVTGSTTNPDSVKVVADWIERDTTVPCSDYRYLYENFYSLSAADKSGNYASPGIGGSTARFTIINDYLYTVTYYDLNVFDISTPLQPVFTNKKRVGSAVIETIYPFKNKLFIGSTTGMFIYDVSAPADPVQQGSFVHARSCDPVIADDNYAWVTLRTGTGCGGNVNQLHVVNINDLRNPSLVKSYDMTNPAGLSKDGNLLFICDGKDGLKIFNAADPNNVKLIKQISGIEPSDVITLSGNALVVAKDGLYQFYYSDLNNIRLLSKIGISAE
jgi:hypothetical protein